MVDQAQPVAVRRRRQESDLGPPAGACGSGTRTGRVAAASRAARHAPVARQVDVDSWPRRPSARESASTTSPARRSWQTARTRRRSSRAQHRRGIANGAIEPEAPTPSEGPPGRAKPVQYGRVAAAIIVPPWIRSRSPRSPAGVRLPPARGARARLQPLLVVAPAARASCSAGSTATRGAATEPGAGPPGRATGPRARRHRLHGRVPDTARRVRLATSPTARATGSSASTPTSWTARSPTSVPSTDCTNRSGIYSGGLGVLAGDHTEGGLGHGPALRRRWASFIATATSARRSTPTATRSTPTPTSTRRACRCCASGTTTAAAPVPVELPGRTVQCRGLAGPGRPRAAAAARHGHPRQRRRGPADHPHPLRPRPRDAAAPGAGAGRRRRARAARAGHLARGLAPQRGPLGVPAGGAGARAGRHGRRARRGPATGPGAKRVHDPHAGLGGQRALRRRPGAARRRAAARRRGGPHGWHEHRGSSSWAGASTTTRASST